MSVCSFLLIFLSSLIVIGLFLAKVSISFTTKMETVPLLLCFLIFAIWNPEINTLPLTKPQGASISDELGRKHQIQKEINQISARHSRQFQDVDDEEEDEEEETTVKGPGHEGILTGISGIFSGIVSGNANSVVESSFNFVPPVYQKEVSNFYGGILGRTTTEPPTTTPTPEEPQSSASRGTNSPLHHGGEEGSAGQQVALPPRQPVKPSASSTGIRTRPRPAPVTAAPVVLRPWASSGDDEEDAKRGI